MNLLAVGIAVVVSAVDSTAETHTPTLTLLFMAWIPIVTIDVLAGNKSRGLSHFVYFVAYTVCVRTLPTLSVPLGATLGSIGMVMALTGALTIYTRLDYERRGYYKQDQQQQEKPDAAAADTPGV